MGRITHRVLVLACLWLGLGWAWSEAQGATNTLAWNKAKDRVDADVRDWELFSLLERVAAETGWQIYVEPDTTYHASARFKNLASGEALRLLLGDLNFALVPQTNGSPRLYVFHTAMQRATRLIRPPGKLAGDAQPRRVPNQLIVRLKSGGDIDKWARTLGAKVIGRIPELNAYLLEFDDAAAADAARLQLGNGSDVASVDNNYYYDSPQPGAA